MGNVTEIVSTRACAGDLLLANDTVTDTRVEDSCAAIEAGPAYTVDTGADVTFRAATLVVLKDGFSVKNGASFVAATEPSLSGDVTRTYVYQDVDYFLTDATGPWGTKSWTYDKIGNRLTEADFDGTDTYNYTPNGAGGNTALLESIALPTLGTRDYQYSPAGHQTQVAAGANVVDFDYDDASRLELATRSTDPPTSTPFLYDGRSFLRHAGDLSTTGTVEPLYDSSGLLLGLLRQPSGAAPQTRYLIFHLAGRPVAQLALETGQSERWWYLTTDHLGTPLVATDGLGEELWENRFEPFGRDMDQGLPWSALESEMLLRFPGQWEDSGWQEATMGTELYNNVHRWYQPAVGRYTRPDPFGIGGGGPNLYFYALANPLRFFDPLGQRVVYEDFPPDRQPDAEQAVQQIKDELEDNPCCVKDDRAEQLLDLINDPGRTVKIKYRPDMNPANCGFTPFTSLIRVNNTIRIGPNAWDCCRGGSPKGVPSLAAVILHELHHFEFRTPEGPADDAMQRCFGCGS